MLSASLNASVLNTFVVVMILTIHELDIDLVQEFGQPSYLRGKANNNPSFQQMIVLIWCLHVKEEEEL